MRVIFIPIISIISLSLQKCNCSKGSCLDEKYFFEIYAKATPVLDSILINDTIWFEINESVNLKDMISNRIINYTDAGNLGSAVGFEELLGNSQRKDAVGDFNYVLISGIEISSVNSARFKEYIFKEESGRYIFRLGIIPKKTGIFRMGFSDAANVYRKIEGCTKAYFMILFKDTNQHLYFNDQNFGITTPLPSNMYCFKVK
jgi:hypothetical protein